jgi:hypothetical protein
VAEVVGHLLALVPYQLEVMVAVGLEHLDLITLLVEFQEMALMVEAVEAVEPTDMELQELLQLVETVEMVWSFLGTSQASHRRKYDKV